MSARRTSKPKYTEEQRREFVTLAGTIGTYKAIKQLGYPVLSTAQEWLDKYGVEPPKSSLALHAATMRHWYADQERRLALQLVLDRAHDILQAGGEPYRDPETGKTSLRHLDARALNALSSAVRRSVDGLQLLDGKATTILEQQGADTAPEIAALIDEYRARNTATVTLLRAVGDGETA